EESVARGVPDRDVRRGRRRRGREPESRRRRRARRRARVHRVADRPPEVPAGEGIVDGEGQDGPRAERMSMRAALAILIVACACAFACKGGSAPTGPAVVPGAPAGDVTEASGDVHATRDGKTRAIATGDVVAGDDVIATGDDGRVTIVLRHNQVPWSLGPNKSKKVGDSAAWAAAKGAKPEDVTDDHSAAAGRHAERSATETTASMDNASGAGSASAAGSAS